MEYEGPLLKFFCTLQDNKNERYVGFIAVQGQNKSIIITPETTNRGDLGNNAHKIPKFIQEPENLQEIMTAQTEQLS